MKMSKVVVVVVVVEVVVAVVGKTLKILLLRIESN